MYCYNVPGNAIFYTQLCSITYVHMHKLSVMRYQVTKAIASQSNFTITAGKIGRMIHGISTAKRITGLPCTHSSSTTYLSYWIVGYGATAKGTTAASYVYSSMTAYMGYRIVC